MATTAQTTTNHTSVCTSHKKREAHGHYRVDVACARGSVLNRSSELLSWLRRFSRYIQEYRTIIGMFPDVNTSTSLVRTR